MTRKRNNRSNNVTFISNNMSIRQMAHVVKPESLSFQLKHMVIGNEEVKREYGLVRVGIFASGWVERRRNRIR
jgi:hypothetical protein